jgi:hypothetical protein
MRAGMVDERRNGSWEESKRDLQEELIVESMVEESLRSKNSCSFQYIFYVNFIYFSKS